MGFEQGEAKQETLDQLKPMKPNKTVFCSVLLPSVFFYRRLEKKVGIGLPLMEEVNAESELSLRFELRGVRKKPLGNFHIYIYMDIYVQNFVTSSLMGKYGTICLKL